MEITNFIDGQSYLTGIQWEPRVPKGEIRRLFEALSKQKGARHGLVHHFNGYATLGIITETGGKSSKPKSPSAAIALSIANSKEYNPDGEKGLGWISVQRVSGDKYWVGSAYNGHPYLRDRVVSPLDIRSAVGELLSDIRAVDVDANIIIFASDEEVFIMLSNAFAQYDGVNVSRKEFEELVADVKYKAEVKSQATAAGLIGAILFVGLLAGGAYYAYDWWSQKEARERQKMREQGKLRDEAALRELQNKYEQDKLEAIKKAKEEAIELVNKKLTIHNKEQLVKEWVKIIGKEHIELPGWVIREFRCSIENEKPVCDYRIERRKDGNVGTVKRLYEHYEATDIEFNRVGEEAKVRRSSDLTLDKSIGDYSILDGYKRLQFQLDTMSKIQLLQVAEIDREFAVPVPVAHSITLPTPPQGINQQMTVVNSDGAAEPYKITLGVEEGSFKITGAGHYKLLGLADRLAEIDKPFKINRLRLITGDVEDWEIDGSYYYQSDVDSNLDTIENEIPKSTIRETTNNK